MATNVRGKDIAEIIADTRGYTKKHEDFNIGDWYGFLNDKNEVLRIKYISTCDSKNNYNIHKKKLEPKANLIAVLKIEDTYKVIIIKEFNSDKIVINYTTPEKSNSNLKLKIDDNNAIQIENEEFICNSIIYKVSQINNTIYSICHRADHKVEVAAIKKLFENSDKCSYCGVTQKQIDKIDEKEKEKQEKSEDCQEPYGLTTRTRGKKLEVDQINPKNGYVKKNITLCCYWCNNAKTDTFSVQEFKEIARGINIAWNMKNKQTGSAETICFPENSDIWNPQEQNYKTIKNPIP